MAEIADLPDLPKVYIYCAGTQGRPVADYLMVAVSDDAELLGAHICSHPSFAMGDLHNQRGRRLAYTQKFGGFGDGEFYKVIQVPQGEEPPAELMALIAEKNAANDEVGRRAVRDGVPAGSEARSEEAQSPKGTEPGVT